MAPGNKRKLVMVGDGETAQLAYQYFTADKEFEVVGFCAESAFMKNRNLYSLPVIAFEEVESRFPPSSHLAFVAVSYTQLNRLRTRLFGEAKMKGYRLCSYISPKAFVGSNAQIGENCFILEHAAIQANVEIGCNVTIWSGSCIGHRTVVGDNCFIASHVAVSGLCNIGENCFLGVNSCVCDGRRIGRDCVVGAGAVVITDTEPAMVYVGNPAKPLPKTVDSLISGEETI